MEFCAILLGDDPKSLVRDLGDLFARDRLIGADSSPGGPLLEDVQEAVQA